MNSLSDLNNYDQLKMVHTMINQFTTQQKLQLTDDDLTEEQLAELNKIEREWVEHPEKFGNWDDFANEIRSEK
jgi:hypothetical protein